MSDEDVAIAEEMRAKAAESSGMRYARALGAAEASLVTIRIMADLLKDKHVALYEIALLARRAEADITRILAEGIDRPTKEPRG